MSSLAIVAHSTGAERRPGRGANVERLLHSNPRKPTTAAFCYTARIMAALGELRGQNGEILRRQVRIEGQFDTKRAPSSRNRGRSPLKLAAD